MSDNAPSANQFFDIKRLPAKPGLLVFLISPGKIDNEQSAENVFEQFRHFTFQGDDKIVEPEVGVNLIYGDTLYMYSEKPSADLKNNTLSKVINHRNEFLNIIKQHREFIRKAFNFFTWNQVQFNLKDKNFFDYLAQVEKMYEEDEVFQQYVQKDYEEIGQRDELDDYQRKFFLEEITLFYLIAKKRIPLWNEFVQGKQEWVLNCYPRKPLWSHIYLQQQNPFNLHAGENKYENAYYDSDAKLLYDFDRLDLNTVEL